MRSMFLIKSFCLALVLGLSAGFAVAAPVTLYRDTWGVPHIYGASSADAAFAIGYAQAEDRLEDIYKNTRTALGRMAEAFGPEHVEMDYAIRLMKNAELCETAWPNLPGELRDFTTGYVNGIKAYVEENPARQPEYALELEPWMCMAVGRAMILRWPIGTMFGKLGKKPEKPEFSSNCFAVAPSRAAHGGAILLTDPHLTWESLAVFWEARVQSPELQMDGFFIVGSPVLGLGHNGHVGWAMTTGGTDTSDVYMLKFRMGLPPQYEYNGEWLTPKLEAIRIPVKGEEKPRVMPSLWTIHGPLLAEPDTENGVAYAGKTPYADEPGIFEQMWRMVKAKDGAEFLDALKMNHLMEQNVTYADRKGNIGYVRLGRTPIRPEGYDWSRPVPGHTSATEWLGIHPVEDHVQILNPEQGYMQNCNISPANMMYGSPLTPDKYARELYNVSWDQNNPRGKRMTQLLAADDSITKEAAKAITMDIYDILAEPWKKALRDALAEVEEQPAAASSLGYAIGELLDWDGEYHQDSIAALYMRFWRLAAQNEVDTEAIAEMGTLGEEELTKLLAALEQACTEIEERFGKRDARWGDMHVVGRNGDYYPYDGADYGRGAIFTETVRDVKGNDAPEAGGRNLANNGAMATMLMFFHEDRIEAYTSTPWGQSAVPDSPHHTDQAREIFSKRTFKPTWFDKAALMENLGSEKVLEPR